MTDATSQSTAEAQTQETEGNFTMNSNSALNAAARLVLAVLAAGVMAASSGVRGADLTWASPGTSGAFETDTNWNPVQAPVTDDLITIGAGTYTVTKTADFNAGAMTVGAGVLLQNQGTLGWSLRDVYSNAGTIQFADGNATWRLWDAQKINYTVYNSGLVQADGITMTLTSRNRTVDNTGGTIEAVNGATITLNTGGSFGMLGGDLGTDASSTFTNIGVNKNIAMNGVAVTNAGTVTLSQTETSGADGNIQRTAFPITNSGDLTNSGTIDIINSSTGLRKAETYVSLDSTSTFTNTGTINITNTGTSSTLHKAYVTSARSLTNAGTVNVAKGASAGDTYFAVTGTGNSFTQSAGAVNLSGGGELRASDIFINGGYLRGIGTITGSTSIGGGATVAPVAPGASSGTLSFIGDLTVAGTYEAEVESLTGASDLLDVIGALTFSDAVLDISLLDNDPGTHSFILATATDGIFGTFTVAGSQYVTGYELGNGGTELVLFMDIPEPGTLALCGLAVGGLVLRRRR